MDHIESALTIFSRAFSSYPLDLNEAKDYENRRNL